MGGRGDDQSAGEVDHGGGRIGRGGVGWIALSTGGGVVVSGVFGEIHHIQKLLVQGNCCSS